MKQFVYLAGPISGLSLDECTNWRNRVTEELNSDMVHCLTPLRGKAILADQPYIHSHEYNDPFLTTRSITRRDMFDTLRSSCIFMNLLDTSKVSIGTMMELAWAYQNQIPTVVLMEKDNIHHHAMVDEACTYIVDSLEEGIRITKTLLEG
jgi:nucleoside 2-deoxyribosyltransferase